MFRKYMFKLIGALGTVLQFGCVTHCALEYVSGFVVCNGPSMEPTIHNNDVLLTEHITPRLQRFNKGDIIIAKCPSDPQRYICKRITALPGDKVYCGLTTCTVPIGHVWLEGDNTSNSTDSRIYGPVPQGLLRSRALCKVWPLTNITIFSANCARKD